MEEGYPLTKGHQGVRKGVHAQPLGQTNLGRPLLYHLQETGVHLFEG